MTEKAERLTENDVHEVCQALQDANDKPTALKVLKVLGRGSLTTISKHIATFNKSPDPLIEQAFTVPDSVKLMADNLLSQIYQIAKQSALADYTQERAALNNENQVLTAKLLEAEQFSAEQANQLDMFVAEFDALKADLALKSAELVNKSNQYHELEVKNSQLVGKLEVYEAIGGSSHSVKPETKPKPKVKIVKPVDSK